MLSTAAALVPYQNMPVQHLPPHADMQASLASEGMQRLLATDAPCIKVDPAVFVKRICQAALCKRQNLL